jgi:hypothetical protein
MCLSGSFPPAIILWGELLGNCPCKAIFGVFGERCHDGLLSLLREAQLGAIGSGSVGVPPSATLNIPAREGWLHRQKTLPAF